MMRRQLLLAAALVVAGVVCGEPFSKMSGTYRYAPTEGEAEAVANAVEQAVVEMSRLLRPIARPRLRNVTRQWDEFTITISDSGVSFIRPELPDFKVELGGAAARWVGDDGKEYQASFAVTNKTSLVQTIKADDGGRTQIFTLDESGVVLTVKTAVNSPKLKAPLNYSRTYRKTE